MKAWKSLKIIIKHVFICINSCMYTNVVKDSSPEVEDVEALDAAATKIVMNS